MDGPVAVGSEGVEDGDSVHGDGVGPLIEEGLWPQVGGFDRLILRHGYQRSFARSEQKIGAWMVMLCSGVTIANAC